ncbi:MAG: hypothetical protein ACSHWZ_01940 [Sulfitobacter sp.]
MRHWQIWLIAGCVSLAGGVFTLLNPASAVGAARMAAGLALLIVGGLQAYSAWKSEAFKGRLGAGLIAGAALALALLVLWGPIGQGGVLRSVFALVLVGSGAAILWFGRAMRGAPLFRVLLAGGAVPIVLGLIVLTGFPGFIAARLGLLLGLELLALGAGLVALALHRKAAAA